MKSAVLTLGRTFSVTFEHRKTVDQQIRHASPSIPHSLLLTDHQRCTAYEQCMYDAHSDEPRAPAMRTESLVLNRKLKGTKLPFGSNFMQAMFHCWIGQDTYFCQVKPPT